MFFKSKILKVPVAKIKEVEAVKSWTVSWNRYYNYTNLHAAFEKSYEVFISEESAKEFVLSLQTCHTFLRNTSPLGVSIKEN